MILDIGQQLLDGLLATTWLEYIAVFFGIASVVYARMEHIAVYPTGLINTTIYIYLSLIGGLYAEAGVNFYYTVLSITGWILWANKKDGALVLHITRSTPGEWLRSTGFFAACWLVLYLVLKHLTNSTVPLADSFASAAAYTGMLLMTRKKLENWLWWILTDFASIPLYISKGFVFTGFQYLVFLALAFMGYFEWRKKLNQASAGFAATAPNT